MRRKAALPRFIVVISVMAMTTLTTACSDNGNRHPLSDAELDVEAKKLETAAEQIVQDELQKKVYDPASLLPLEKSERR